MEEHEHPEQPPREEGKQDISSKTVFVLVLLTLAVSFVGAWVSVASVSELGVTQVVVENPPSAGRVTFEIVEPGDDASAATVGFEIVDATG